MPAALAVLLIQIAATYGPTFVAQLISLFQENPAAFTAEQIEALKGNVQDPSSYFTKPTVTKPA